MPAPGLASTARGQRVLAGSHGPRRCGEISDLALAALPDPGYQTSAETIGYEQPSRGREDIYGSEFGAVHCAPTRAKSIADRCGSALVAATQDVRSARETRSDGLPSRGRRRICGYASWPPGEPVPDPRWGGCHESK